MELEHPILGKVPTYGGPFDSYTIPYVDFDGDLRCERYDHDRGEWIEGGEPLAVYLTREQPEDSQLPEWVDRYQRSLFGAKYPAYVHTWNWQSHPEGYNDICACWTCRESAN